MIFFCVIKTSHQALLFFVGEFMSLFKGSQQRKKYFSKQSILIKLHYHINEVIFTTSTWNNISHFFYIIIQLHTNTPMICTQKSLHVQRAAIVCALMIHYSLFLHPGDFQLLWVTHHYSNNGASVWKPLFSVSSLTVRWPSVWVVSAQKGFVVRNSSESRDHKSALKQKHQEKPSSSPSAHTRPPSLCWVSLLSLSLFDSSFFPKSISVFSACSLLYMPLLYPFTLPLYF